MKCKEHIMHIKETAKKKVNSLKENILFIKENFNTETFKCYIPVKNYKYSDYADNVIKKLMQCSKIIKCDEFYLYVEYDSKIYWIWIANYPYADLQSVYVTRADNKSGHNTEIVYNHMRTSAKVQVEFWNWIKKENPEVFDIIKTNNIRYDDKLRIPQLQYTTYKELVDDSNKHDI